MFTPKNITTNCSFAHVWFSENPVNSGNQWVNPAIIANTAPIDNT